VTARGCLLAGISLTVVLSSCKGKETPPPDSSGATASMPGKLDKPLSEYTGDQFYDFVQHLKWGGGAEKERKCKGDTSCDGDNPPKKTLVRVDAVDEQDSLSAEAAGPNGVVAVRAINKGDAEEARYGFKANKKLEYYLIVLPGDKEAGRWQLEELDTTPNARKHTTVGSGKFRGCNHPFQPHRANRANFYTCTDSHMTDTVQKSGLLMFAPPTDPIWVDCIHGCCIAE